MEMFDDVLRMQNQLQADFTRHDDRQERFKKQFARDTRRHRSAISGLACVMNSTPTSNTVLYAPSSAQEPRVEPMTAEGSAGGPARRGSAVSRQLNRLKDPHAQRLREELACFYLPPVVTTDIVCDSCGAFKSATLVLPLPEPWMEYICEGSGKRYYYHQPSKKVLWSPPPDSSPFSVFVFERTNSVASVCRCIPSHERRVRCMEKFREYAKNAAHQEIEARNKKLHGAFKTLAHTVTKKPTNY